MIGTCKLLGHTYDSTCVGTPGGYYFEICMRCADMSIQGSSTHFFCIRSPGCSGLGSSRRLYRHRRHRPLPWSEVREPFVA
ncbi:hypothetical protein Y032_0004g2005 [Ancylostoma ceylanicum]|uniref:Uncharacterized protein n=1 Tax=Ancylostoma ceylanicum TaxID=53326 RepID=A0A016VV41_9BILA|nr:hypothetical protein Y032_0004g2005 [Ancylostoma ceylanicum]